MKKEIEKLTLSEKMDLKKLIKGIDDCIDNVVAARAKAQKEGEPMLKQIHERKLYREECATFDEFCIKHWGRTANYTRRLLQAQEVKKSVPIGTITNEAQARALASVPADQRAAVVEAVSAAGPVTAAAITAEAAKFIPPKKEYCKTGAVIPEDLKPIWNRRKEVQEMLGSLSEMKSHIKKALDDEDVLYVEVSNSVLTIIGNLYQTINLAYPYAICTSCNGKNVEKCGLCKGRGFISKFKFDGPAVTDKIRKMRLELGKDKV